MRACSVMLLLASALSSAAAPDAGRNDAESRSRLVKAYGQLPLRFEENRGQADSRVKFLSRGSGYSLSLTPGEAVLALPSAAGSTAPLRMKLVGANDLARIVGLEELPGKNNYFIGNDPKKWQRNVPTFARVKYERVYPGVDLVFYGNQGQMEFDFILKPGADPGRIELDLEADASTEPRIETNGDVLLKAGGGEMRFHKPVVYQSSAERRTPVDGRFVKRGGNRVGFEIASYDPAKPLVIDPAIVYSTYLDGTNGGSESGTAIATYTDPVTGHVYAYVAGFTTASDFPTINAQQPLYVGCCADAFITKFDPSAAGTASVIYSTYLGGGDVTALGIAVDSGGNAYITGFSNSSNFPTTVNAYQSAIKFGPLCSSCSAGTTDAFLAKLSASGSTLMYSTFFGGSGADGAQAIALDSAGHAYIAGITYSSDLPTRNPFRAAIQGPGDIYVAIFDTTQSGPSSLLYSTYLGASLPNSGGIREYGDSVVAVDATGGVHLLATTSAPSLPVVNGFQTYPAAPGNVTPFYAKLNPLAPAPSQLVYSTYFDAQDGLGHQAFGIAVDSSGYAYAQWGPWVSKINPLVSGPASLVYSVNTVSGGGGVAVDVSGNAFVGGGAGPWYAVGQSHPGVPIGTGIDA